MNTLNDSGYNSKTGEIEGEHLRHLGSMGIHRLVERANAQQFGPGCRLQAADLPSKVTKLVEESNRLAEQLLRCEGVCLAMARDYVAAQVKIAAAALPLMLAEVQRRETEARDAVAGVRAAWTGKATSPVLDAVVAALIDSTHAVEIAEREAGLPAWRTACALCRDAANNKAMPRWLAIMAQRFEAETAAAAR